MSRNNRRTILRHSGASRGTSLIEVLMAMFILTFGLLGLAALQGRANSAEMESYQRGQALILLQDMVSRMENNTANAASYVTATALGTGTPDVDCVGTRAAIDQCEWSKALKGASETKGTAKQGAMINGRGCIEVKVAAKEYTVAVVWQGFAKTIAPATTACGSDAYDSADTRRAVTSIVRVADLAAS
jgi:type IV pilus assembly protein PilV